MSFKNKVVLITGSSSGIGAATAELFAKEGAAVVIVGRNEANLKKVADHCEKYGGSTLIVKADVTKDEDLNTVIKQTIEKFKKLDVLVNNAGTTGTTNKENFMETFDNIMNTNLRAAVLLTSLAIPYLIKTKGSIVNISSILGVSFVEGLNLLFYGISKAGLNHFTRGTALKLSTTGVRVNAVSPGPVRTDILPNAGIYEPEAVFKVNRISEPEEISELILYLASEKARSITGANFLIDNGALLKN